MRMHSTKASHLNRIMTECLLRVSNRNAVMAAIDEFDTLGRDEFLSKYGFGKSRQYFVAYEGKLYDSKAIVGVAHQYADPEGRILRAADFSGGDATGVCSSASTHVCASNAGSGNSNLTGSGMPPFIATPIPSVQTAGRSRLRPEHVVLRSQGTKDHGH
jgi:hypothetical protein